MEYLLAFRSEFHRRTRFSWNMIFPSCRTGGIVKLWYCWPWSTSWIFTFQFHLHSTAFMKWSFLVLSECNSSPVEQSDSPLHMLDHSSLILQRDEPLKHKTQFTLGRQWTEKGEKEKWVSRATGWMSTALAGSPPLLQRRQRWNTAWGCLLASLLYTCSKPPQRHSGVMKESVLFFIAPLIKHILYCFYFKIDYLKWKQKVPSDFFLYWIYFKLNACDQTEKDTCYMTNINIMLFILGYPSVMLQVQI